METGTYGTIKFSYFKKFRKSKGLSLSRNIREPLEPFKLKCGQHVQTNLNSLL